MRKDNKGRNLRTGESQRADGKYMYRYTDLTGKRQTIYSWRLTALDRTPKGKKEDISLREKEEEISLQVKLNKGGLQAKQLTLNDVFDIYLERKHHKGRPLAKTTKDNYKGMFDKNIRNTILGHKKISDICRSDIINFYHSLIDGGLSYGTALFFHKVLSAVFNFAIDDLELINKNPCRKALTNIGGKQQETEVLTKAQDEALLKYLRDNGKSVYPVYLLMRQTMVRVGECIAITKSDIDYDKKTLRVDKQLIWYKAEDENKARLHISETKGRNIRYIPLTDELLKILKELSEKATDDVSIDGVSGFLFTKYGKAYTPYDLSTDLKDAVLEYNVFNGDRIEHFTPKILRHTGCTMYAREGMDISVLQYIMGHKSVHTTMRFYNHVTEERVLDTFKEHIKESA